MLHYSKSWTKIVKAARHRDRRPIVFNNYLGLIRSVGAVAMLLSSASCSENHRLPKQQTPPAAPAPAMNSQDSRFEGVATIRELMDYMVDPAADAVWNSVAILYTQSGVDRKEPRTDDEWKAVRGQAVTLIESTNLLIMDSRRAAPAGTVPGEGELTAADIDQLLATQRAAFVGLALGLRVASQKALTAIDKKDAVELIKTGGDIDEACEACHVVFWYPDQKVPKR